MKRFTGLVGIEKTNMRRRSVREHHSSGEGGDLDGGGEAGRERGEPGWVQSASKFILSE